MDSSHWAYCPDRKGVCGVVVADAERADRDAVRIATLGADLNRVLAELDQARRDLARARAEARDLERENASLRRRLREGGR
jgi:hypothetical protein